MAGPLQVTVLFCDPFSLAPPWPHLLPPLPFQCSPASCPSLPGTRRSAASSLLLRTAWRGSGGLPPLSVRPPLPPHLDLPTPLLTFGPAALPSASFLQEHHGCVPPVRPLVGRAHGNRASEGAAVGRRGHLRAFERPRPRRRRGSLRFPFPLLSAIPSLPSPPTNASDPRSSA